MTSFTLIEQARLRTKAAVAGCAIMVALLCAMAAFPASSYADVRKSDIISGETIESRGLSVAQCPSIDAKYAYVVDAGGTVYFERAATDDTKIASVTKVMTAVTALDSVPTDTKVTVSSNAATIGESSANLQEGDTMTLSEALRAMLLPSGNDAAEAIAESVGAVMLQSQGKDSSKTDDCVNAFVDAMNAKSAELGLVNSVWRNPHGLDDGNYSGDQHSCAQDIGTLAIYAMKKQAIRDCVDQESGSCTITRDGQKVELKLTSTDELIGVYDGACGIKTGFTDLAGGCFAGACNRDGEDLYAIVLNSTTEATRFTDATTLWDWVYAHRVNYKLANSSQNVTNKAGQSVPLAAKVSDGLWVDKTIDASLQDVNQSVEVFSVSGNISQTAEYKKITGDVKAGDVVGTITFKQHNNVIATANLVATQDVPGPNLFEGIGIWWNRLFSSFGGDDGVADSVLVNETPIINDKTAA